jgi:hydroxymethylpyrimidine/phosphomethylpyrimidine kinase
MSVIAALTSQNTKEVTHIMPATVESVVTQLDAVLSDVGADGIKTGMLFSAPIIEAVSERLAHYGAENLVVDPVAVASSGAVLLETTAVSALKKHLFPLAKVITPNIPEAEMLTGMKIDSVADVKEACKRLAALGCRSVLIKGGHAMGHADNKALDIWYDGKSYYEFIGEWTATKNLHGTGCTFSAAIAAHLAKHEPLEQAIHKAKIYITGAIAAGDRLHIGHGHGPVDHAWESRHE